MDAHALDGVFERSFAGKIFRHARLHVAALAAVEGVCGVEREQPRGAGARRHLAEFQLDRLMLADRLAEGFAHLRIVGGEFQRTLCDADAARGDINAPKLEPTCDLEKTL